MRVSRISNATDYKKRLKNLGVDSGGINILAAKMQNYILFIEDMHVGAANILKQDALSIGADLAVPRGTVTASVQRVDCILIANKRQLQILSKKELAQPFGLKTLATELKNIASTTKSRHVEIMGVINANEDSFYEKSRFKNENAIAKIEQMIADGASIIDLGGVSSKPNAQKVEVQEELRRVKPIIDLIFSSELYKKARFSIDSFEPKVIEYALKNGFSIVNDITGLENDAVCKLCATYDATAIIMHMQGTPQTMQDAPTYKNVVMDVYDFLNQRVQKAESFGIKDIVLDVGIGFGKTLEDNLELVKNLESFLSLNKTILLGASRKSMIDKIYPSEIQERLPGTLAIHLEGVKNGASILRVHDVREHAQAISIAKALDSI